MTRYLTQIITDTGGPILGDCWRTAVACLLELHVEEVPHFGQLYRHIEGGWWSAAVQFARDRGHTLVDLDPTFPVTNSASPHVIAIGPSPRNSTHAVLFGATRGVPVWDPHPSRAFLAGPPVMLAAIVRGA